MAKSRVNFVLCVQGEQKEGSPLPAVGTDATCTLEMEGVPCEYLALPSTTALQVTEFRCWSALDDGASVRRSPCGGGLRPPNESVGPELSWCKCVPCQYFTMSRWS